MTNTNFYVPVTVYENDTELQRLTAERDRLLNSEDPTGLVAAQNAVAARSLAIRREHRDAMYRKAHDLANAIGGLSGVGYASVHNSSGCPVVAVIGRNSDRLGSIRISGDLRAVPDNSTVGAMLGLVHEV